MPAAASGWMNDASTPVCVSGNGPFNLKQTDGPTACTPSGTFAAGQTTESSSAVRVTETNGLRSAHCGMGASGGSRHTENCPGTREYSSDNECVGKFIRG